MSYFFFSLTIFLFIFLQIPLLQFEETPHLTFLFKYNIFSGKTFPESYHVGEIFNGVLKKNHKSKLMEVRLTSGHSLPVREPSRALVPFLGSGYFTYYKVGNELLYRSRKGELLWQKEYRSYPVSDHRGKLLLLLSGDNNRVFILDENGNPTGIKSLVGNFLVDYDFAYRESAVAIAFSGGSFYILNGDGNIVLKYSEKSGKERFFTKSCAISPDGRIAAIHMLLGGSDSILLLKRDGDKKEAVPLKRIKLKKVYPHILHMALNRSGLIIAAPDQTSFYDLKGNKIWRREAIDTNRSIYRPVFSGIDFFLFGRAGNVTLLDEKGRELINWEISGSEKEPWRILPGKNRGEFALEKGKFIYFFRISTDTN